jgi:hypothetical protein
VRELYARYTRIMGRWILGFLLAAATVVAGQHPTAPIAVERPLPDFQAFAAKVRAHLATDQERQSGYVFVERRIEQKIDGSGKVTDESTKVFEVYPGLEGEERYRRLIEEDGHRVPADKLEKQDRERKREVEEYARQTTQAASREKQARESEKRRRRLAAAIDDLFRVYDIKMVRRDRLDGHDTIFATLTPNGVKPQTDDGKIMTHFKARAWVSETDYELVRVEVESIKELSFGMGLLARVHKGTLATFERRKVNNEVWLPAKATWTGSGRVLLLRQLRLRGISEFSGYRKFSVETDWTVTSK